METIELHSQQLFCVDIQVYYELNKGLVNDIHDTDIDHGNTVQ